MPFAKRHNRRRSHITESCVERRGRSERTALWQSASTPPDPPRTHLHLTQKLHDPRLRATDDGFVVSEKHGALQELLVLQEDFDDGLGIADVVIGIQLQFLELRIFPHEILDRILEDRNDLFQLLPSRRGFDVKDNLVLNS